MNLSEENVDWGGGGEEILRRSDTEHYLMHVKMHMCPDGHTVTPRDPQSRVQKLRFASMKLHQHGYEVHAKASEQNDRCKACTATPMRDWQSTVGDFGDCSQEIHHKTKGNLHKSIQSSKPKDGRQKVQ